MADGDEETGGEGGEETGAPPKETGKQLREKLETALSQNADLAGRLAIHDAGLSHLSEKQRRAVVRDAGEDGKEVTADTLKAAAKELGFATEAPKEKAEGEGGNENEGGEGVNNNGDETEVEEALTSFEAIERARRRSVPDTDPQSFENRMKATKSTAEAEALIKREGHKVGIVHEHDID